jgi:hypothetical protein
MSERFSASVSRCQYLDRLNFGLASAFHPNLPSTSDPLRTFAKGHFSDLPHLLLMTLILTAVMIRLQFRQETSI